MNMSQLVIDPSQLVVPASERDHIAGSLEAPVILVEYGDFECPHCGRAYPIVKGAKQYLGKELAVVYRHFPLAEMHPHATLAAEAAEAAGAQGKFWEMHDMLFEHQDALEQEDLVAYAEMLDLDVTRFTRELASGVHVKKVTDDFRGGVRSGVNGTPTFFINGERFDGNWTNSAAFISLLAQAAGVEHASGPIGSDR
jgi:formate-nitrite transporter family protein